MRCNFFIFVLASLSCFSNTLIGERKSHHIIENFLRFVQHIEQSVLLLNPSIRKSKEIKNPISTTNHHFDEFELRIAFKSISAFIRVEQSTSVFIFSFNCFVNSSTCLSSCSLSLSILSSKGRDDDVVLSISIVFFIKGRFFDIDEDNIY